MLLHRELVPVNKLFSLAAGTKHRSCFLSTQLHTEALTHPLKHQGFNWGLTGDDLGLAKAV